MSFSLTFFTPNIPTLNPTTTPKPKPKLKLKKPKNNNTQTQRFSIPKCSLTTTTTFSDPFVLQLAESLEDSLPTTTTTSKSPPLIQKIRDNSSQSLLTTPWPSRKHESFRFTDLSLIRNSQLYPVRQHPDNLKILETDENNVVVVADGFVGGFGTLGSDQNGIFIGRVGDLGDESVVLERVRECMCDFEFGDLFWSVNGMGFQDLVVVYVPSGCRVERPVCFRYVAVEGGEGGVLPVSNPRALVVVEKGGEVGIVEEFVGGEDGVGGKCYWMNSVLEVVVGEGGKVTHSYVQSQSLDAAHTKWTSVRQESASSYELVEVSTGGKLSRHNLHIQQLGPDTSTKLSTLHVSTSDQTQDLHSRLVLDHPRGYSQQLHKCIVAHSQGQAVFDGNVKVNRYAQQTDAGQLTRSLLLEPRATVNLKPNLQIIADDVKCSHGAAISDLEDSQLFYFLARGIDLETARKALIVSFAKEVIERLPHKYLRDKVDSLMKELLDPAR